MTTTPMNLDFMRHCQEVLPRGHQVRYNGRTILVDNLGRVYATEPHGEWTLTPPLRLAVARRRDA